MNVALTASISHLAHATASYESAWRASLIRDSNAAAAMQDAYRKQVDALEAVASHVGIDTARTIHGALIATATLVDGERLDPHRNHIRTSQDVHSFIVKVESGEAGI